MNAKWRLEPECGRGRIHSVARGIGAALALAIAFAVLSGCVNRTDAQKLADSGLSAASTLANYYNTLSQQLDDIYEMESFSNALRGIPRDQDYEQQLQETQEALQRRSRLAQQLAASYQSLKGLSSYNASGEVSASFDKLRQALTGIPPLKSLTKGASTAPVDPEKLLSKGVGLLAGWKQTRDIQQAVRVMTETLNGLNNLFAHELPACQSISQEYVEKAGVVGSELVKRSLVVAWPLLEQELQSMGLKLANPDVPPTDPAVKEALAQVVRARAFRLEGLSNSAGQSLLGALNHQLTSQHRFQAKQRISISDVQTAIEKATDLLDEIAKQRSSKKS